MTNPFTNAQKQLETAASLIKLPDDILERLKWPDRVLKFHIPVIMDNGKVQMFEGFRSQHNNARGPYKGGIRFHPGVNEEEVKALSMWMTWKCATTGIPYGGGKGGIVVDPAKLSQNELERLSRGYIRKIAGFIGEDVDVPAPDVNTNGQIMSWMLDEFCRIKGRQEWGVFTGKPLNLGGSLGREQATGQGGVYVLLQLAKDLGLKPEKTTLAVQGFGNVGYWFAKLAETAGFRIVALSDSKGGVYCTEGLNVEAVMRHKKEHKTLADYSKPGLKVSKISNRDILELPVDILAPAALENVITGGNAKAIKAKNIIEMANGPVTPEADEVLFQRKITVVPDVLANAGGVTVSYFEWVQNKMGYYWPESEVLEKLQPLMNHAFNQSYKTAKEYKVDMRTGTYALAVKKVADAMQARGL